jgi:nucleoside-diphosphate-sugar epimerase
MEASKRLHCAPDTDAWRFEMTPVDFLVQAIVRFAQDPAHFGQVYNVVQAEPTPARFVFDLLRDQGEVADYVSAEQWKARLYARAEQEEAPLFSVLAQSLEDVEPYLTDTSTYDCAHFDRAVSAYGLKRPATDGVYFAKLLA